jgi:hypothetical protein
MRMYGKRYVSIIGFAKNFYEVHKGNGIGDINFATFGYAELAFDCAEPTFVFKLNGLVRQPPVLKL